MEQLLSSPPFWGFATAALMLVGAAIKALYNRFRRISTHNLQLMNQVHELQTDKANLTERLEQTQERLIEACQQSNQELLASHGAMRSMNEILVSSFYRAHDQQPREPFKNELASSNPSGKSG
jgi:predicted transcriptional regulator